MSFWGEQELKGEKKDLQNLRDKIDTLLLNWEDLESDLQKSSDIKDLPGLIADLGLSLDLEDKASYLVENYQQVKTGVENILAILYKLKKNIKSLQ